MSATPVSETRCTAPWTTMEIVDPDGRVRQCCADWTRGARGAFSPAASLRDLWNGPGYRDARRLMAAHQTADLCRAVCPRLHDLRDAASALQVHPGSPAFVENQRLLRDDVAEGREVARALPIYLALCPSTYCNYDCVMCLHGRSARRELADSLWDELPSLLPTLRVLTLLGGEPLASPRAMRFLQEFDRARWPDAAVSLITNGSLLTAPALRRMRACRFANVTLSLNAGTPEAYRRVQRGAELDEVLANLDALLALRREQGSRFPVTLSFVVMPMNAHTLPDFAALAEARDLPIRLLPLDVHDSPELDFYGDPEAVASVLARLDDLAEAAQTRHPRWLREIHGTRSAIAATAAERSRRRLPIRQPR